MFVRLISSMVIVDFVDFVGREEMIWLLVRISISVRVYDLVNIMGLDYV